MNQRLTQLLSIKAGELSGEDYILVSDVWDEEHRGSVSKKMKVSEFMKYIQRHLQDYYDD